MTTLLQLRDRVKQETDNVSSGFITDTEWNSYLQASYQELYGLIVESFGNDYFTQSPASGFIITTDGTNEMFALPTDFFKLLAVDLQVSAPGYWVGLKPFTMAERNSFGLLGTMVPMANQTVRLLYVPRCPTLSSDSSVVDGVNGWEEYIVVDAGIKALAKEESDASVMMARKAQLLARLTSEVNNRDIGSPATVSDVQGRRARAMRYRLNGNSLWLRGNGMPGWGPWGDWPTDADYGGVW